MKVFDPFPANISAVIATEQFKTKKCGGLA